MSSNVSNPRLEYHYRKNVWQLLECYTIEGVSIPRGFESDGATVPRFLWWFVPPTGRHLPAVLVHDYLYQHAIGTKDAADKTFYRALRQCGIGLVKSLLMYWGVKIGGRGEY